MNRIFATVSAITLAAGISLIAAGAPAFAAVGPAVLDPASTTSTSTTSTSTGSTSVSPAAVSPAAVPQAGACIDNPTFSYTYDLATASGTITVASVGATANEPICLPLYIRSATYTYDLPTDGTTPSWSQSLHSQNQLLVNTVGTFSFVAPDASMGCSQHDTYAYLATATSDIGFGALQLPPTLYGAGIPFEPQFLSQVFPGDGPAQTFIAEPSDACTAIVPSVPVTIPSDPTGVGQVCALPASGAQVSGYILVALAPGVAYSIQPVSPAGAAIAAVSAKTLVEPGTYLVTATALAGFTLENPMAVTVSVAANPTVCEPATTTPVVTPTAETAATVASPIVESAVLASTGVDAWPAIAFGLAFLIIGACSVLIARRNTGLMSKH